MDPSVRLVLGIAMRWLHIVSIVTILGGFVFARFALYPALRELPAADGQAMGSKIAAKFRALLYTAVATALLSGFYNYLTKPSYPRGYHMWLGIKILFALHVFAASILYALPGAADAKRSRWAMGIVLSGAVIVLISAYLRWISLNPPPIQ